MAWRVASVTEEQKVESVELDTTATIRTKRQNPGEKGAVRLAGPRAKQELQPRDRWQNMKKYVIFWCFGISGKEW